MKIFERAVFVLGLAMLVFLIWKFEPAHVWAISSQIGWGFLAVLAYQATDQSLNAVAWRFCFTDKEAKGLPFWPLFLGRVAGDGVNYLTPSGTVAGEFVRPGVLGNIRSEEVKNSSVAIGKFAQAIGQAVFIFLGFVFVLPRYVSFLHGRDLVVAAVLSFMAVLFLSGSLYAALSDRFFSLVSKLGPKVKSKVSDIRSSMKSYLKKHPYRWGLAIAFFCLGYAAGAGEILIVCYFLKIQMPFLMALAAEMLSNVIDGIFFFVPAKLGTQEAGKTAIFVILGYPAAQGLAFGLIRHARELLWSAAGFGIFSFSQRRTLRFSRRAGSRPSSKPLGPADSLKP